MSQDMKKYIRTLMVLTVLMLGAGSEMWAQSLSNSDIEIDPNIANGTITLKSLETRTVTLTVTPSSDYYIKASDIVVNKESKAEEQDAEIVQDYVNYSSGPRGYPHAFPVLVREADGAEISLQSSEYHRYQKRRHHHPGSEKALPEHENLWGKDFYK